MIRNHSDAFSAKVASTTLGPVWFAPGGVFLSVLISDPEWPNSASTRAAIIRKGRSGIVVRRDAALSIVTPDDCLSESEAELTAQKLIRENLVVS
jgi:hypothetical protein